VLVYCIAHVEPSLGLDAKDEAVVLVGVGRTGDRTLKIFRPYGEGCEGAQFRTGEEASPGLDRRSDRDDTQRTAVAKARSLPDFPAVSHVRRYPSAPDIGERQIGRVRQVPIEVAFRESPWPVGSAQSGPLSSWVDAGGGVMISTSVFQDQASAEESNGRAADYVRQKFSLCAPKPAPDHSR
jgi:hypothetical protein